MSHINDGDDLISETKRKVKEINEDIVHKLSKILTMKGVERYKKWEVKERELRIG